MCFVYRLDQIKDDMLPVVGGKALALSQLARAGLSVPEGLCIAADAYRRFVGETGLRERILLELSRKPFNEMRWEELWDAALRIRNAFLRTTLRNSMADVLRQSLERQFGDHPVVVRSSAPEEDSESVSFAGLHESYVNISGAEAILDHVRLVWASLWSDRALLYRRELKLDVENSSMAVVVQELVEGEASGVAFSRSPVDETVAVVEAVYGLNQGLVDGAVEPDSWTVGRESGQVIMHRPAERNHRMVRASSGVQLEPLPIAKRGSPPLDDANVQKVFEQVKQSETFFERPQDVEWTMKKGQVHLLQSRPITTIRPEGEEDKRSWYLGLRRSFENLKKLRIRIEEVLVPSMIEEADDFAKTDLESLQDAQLAEEIVRRARVHSHWVDVYWDEFIPFAHGTRLFGQIYNDAVKPSDPFEFTRLLVDDDLISLRRNRLFLKIAAAIRQDEEIKDALSIKAWESLAEEFRAQIRTLAEDCGCLAPKAPLNSDSLDGLLNLLLQAAEGETSDTQAGADDAGQLRASFLDKFEGNEKAFANEVLDLALASNRMRDDDNVYLGRIEASKARAVSEGQRRLERGSASKEDTQELRAALDLAEELPKHKSTDKAGQADPSAAARQIVGQPASPGIETGTARVILDSSDVFKFKSGEVLVCDAIDPNMTFVVPLCAGIVERRGGMLIHGAIIAREYGVPCVTGVSGATGQIQTGNQVTVDGYLGIVTIDREG